MTTQPTIAVLHGGISAEREVSLGSGRAAAEAFSRLYPVELMDVTEAALPSGLDAERHVVFSTLHGTFGEDGQIQALMQAAGVIYAGCDAESSRLTFDKVSTKERLKEHGVAVLEHMAFQRRQVPSANQVVDALGPSVVIKPVRQGSSVGLRFAEGAMAIASALQDLEFDRWLIERRVKGREVTIGVLDGKSLEVVEIRPKSGAFDYQSKYTKGLTDYLAPAPLEEGLRQEIKEVAERAFALAGCRDFARVDMMVDGDGRPYVLEINTLPGLKETSLLPMSAQACGYDFEMLLQRLVRPAFNRYHQQYSLP